MFPPSTHGHRYALPVRDELMALHLPGSRVGDQLIVRVIPPAELARHVGRYALIVLDGERRAFPYRVDEVTAAGVVHYGESADHARENEAPLAEVRSAAVVESLCRAVA